MLASLAEYHLEDALSLVQFGQSQETVAVQPLQYIPIDVLEQIAEQSFLVKSVLSMLKVKEQTPP